MADKTCSLERVGDEIELILEDFERQLDEQLRKDIRAAGRVTLKHLKSAGDPASHTGMYKRNWRCDTRFDNAYVYRSVIYEAAPSYRLTHLLEKGHAGPKSGSPRTPAHVHIEPAATAGMRELERRMGV